MSELISVGIVLASIVAGLLGFAPRVSAWLVRTTAHRLPKALSERMREEWLAELGALPGRSSQLAFAIALTLTRRHSFAIEDESVFAAPSRSPFTVSSFGGWPTVVLFTTVVAAAIAYAASFLIEPLYQSHTRLLVVPQRIPARFVEPAAREPLAERVRVFKSNVLGDRGLERVIREFDLYKSDREGGTVSDALIERMRRNIDVTLHADGQSFEITYASTAPRMAMLVTERLATLFFKADRDKDEIGRSAVTFLNAQIKEVRSRLLKPAGNTGLSPSSDSDADVRALEREALKATYRDLLLKKEQAILTSQLEGAQMGEQFRMVEGARLPEAPVSPNRTGLTLLGAGIGFCLGVAMMRAGRDGSSKRSQEMLAQS